MITENNFTAAELEAALQANPALIDEVKTYASKGKYAFRSEQEEQTYVSNLEAQHINKHVSAFAPQVEKAVKDLTGIEKVDANEKYYEYNSRALKTIAEERKQLRTELDTLKGQTDLSKFERQQLEELKDKVKEYDTQIKNLQDNSSKEISKARLENRITQQANSISGKLIKDTRPGVMKALSIMSESIISEISSMAQVDQRGEIILVSNEKALTNSDGSFKTASQYYEEKMNEAGFVETGKQAQGAGGNTPNVDVKNIPGGAKSQTELMDWLRENTMKGKDQKELIKEFDKYAHLLPR